MISQSQLLSTPIGLSNLLFDELAVEFKSQGSEFDISQLSITTTCESDFVSRMKLIESRQASTLFWLALETTSDQQDFMNRSQGCSRNQYRIFCKAHRLYVESYVNSSPDSNNIILLTLPLNEENQVSIDWNLQDQVLDTLGSDSDSLIIKIHQYHETFFHKWDPNEFKDYLASRIQNMADSEEVVKISEDDYGTQNSVLAVNCWLGYSTSEIFNYTLVSSIQFDFEFEDCFFIQTKNHHKYLIIRRFTIFKAEIKNYIDDSVNKELSDFLAY